MAANPAIPFLPAQDLAVGRDLHLHLKSSPEAVPALSSAFAAFAAELGLSLRTRSAVNLALEEVVTNVIVHGYQGREGMPIEVEVKVRLGELVACVEDQAPPFDPVCAPEPDLSLPLEQRQPGGVGIHLVRNMMDRLEYTRADGRNRLVITKRLESGSTMQIEELECNGITVLVLHGRIDAASAEGTKQKLLAAVGSPPVRVVVDLRDIDYISSIGLRGLLEARRKAADLQGQFLLCGMADHVREVFDLSGLSRVVSIYPSRDAALAALA
jgi:serine/threonine-protein kinase RsbW